MAFLRVGDRACYFFRVRLGSYIALELAVGAILLGGAVAGSLVVVSAVAPRLHSQPVQAAAATAPARPAVKPPAAAPAGAAAPSLDPAVDPALDPAAAIDPSTDPSTDPSVDPPPSSNPRLAAAAPAVGAGAEPRPPASDVALAAIAPAPSGDRPAAPASATPSTAPAGVAAISASGSAAGSPPASPAISTSDPGAARPSAEVAATSRRRATVYGAPDSELLAPLRDSPVTGCKLNYGGTSLSLRLDFESGGRAAFKPDQVHAQSQPRREVAAFRVDRMLGIGHVPPAAAITVSFEQLLASIAPAARGEVGGRVRAEARARRGQLRGSASWWIPEIKVAAIGKHPIDSTDGIVTWKRYLTIGAERTPEITAFVSQISDMVLFDFLIDNSDRWSGGNARTSMDGRILYFMDNTLAFTRNKQAHSRTTTYLHRVKIFSRRLVEAVRSFTREELVAALSSTEDGALAPLLSDEEIDAVMARRELAVAYIDELIATHGEEQVLAFP